MTARILVACGPGEWRVAVAEGDALIEYGIWRPGRPDGVGAVHRGRVVKAMPALGGCFVAIEGAEGFLPDKAPPGEGSLVNVRVVRAAQGGKGPRLALSEDATEGEARRLAGAPGLLAEIVAAYPGAPIEADQADAVPGARVVRSVWPDAIASAVEALEASDVALAAGVRARIVPTPALVAIDIDFDGAGRGQKATAQMAANLAVLPALCRQVQLRNLSGAILIDFAGLPARKRQALKPALEAALAADRLGPRLLGFTQLGLAEIVRPRVHPPLHELLAGPHAAGLRALRAAADMVRDEPAARPWLRAAPAVVAALHEDPVALPQLASRIGWPMVVRSDPSIGGHGWSLERTA